MDLITGEIPSLQLLQQNDIRAISELEKVLRSIRADMQRLVSTEGLDEELAAIAGLVSAANKLPYFTGSGTADVATLTAFARTILDDADEATFKATVNLQIGTDVQAYDAGLTNLAGVAMAANKFYYTTADNAHAAASVTVFARTILDDADASTVRTTIGLGADDTAEFDGLRINGISGALKATAGVISGTAETLITFTALNNEPPSSNFATPDTRNSIPVLDFDDSTNESAEFGGFMPQSYTGGGVIVTLGWMATDTIVTPHNVVWDVAFKSVSNDADDLDAKSFAEANSFVDAEPSASGEVAYGIVTFTNGADMDSVGAGEYFRLRITREADNGSDTLTDDAELLFVEIREA